MVDNFYEKALSTARKPAAKNRKSLARDPLDDTEFSSEDLNVLLAALARALIRNPVVPPPPCPLCGHTP